MSDEFEGMRVPPPERLYVDALGYVWQDGALPGHLSMARTTDRNVASPGLIEYRPVVVTEEKARRVVNADVVLAALRTIGVGLAAARGAHERAVAVSNARARLARLVDQIEGQARPASPATRETAPPAYLALDLWMALGADSREFDGYYDRNGWANTWSNLLEAVRARSGRVTCPIWQDGEPCVLVDGHIGPHMGYSDVGSSEPLPLTEQPAATRETVTEERVRSAALAMYRMANELSMSGARDLARAALEAALAEKGDES